MYRKYMSTWRYPLVLLTVYGILWIALAIDPVFRKDWLLENAIVFVALPLFAATARRLRFSDFAYTCLFVFFVFHAVGAHYTYSLVPYAEWWESLGGAALEGRNHYDRLVHFLYGLLVAPAAVVCAAITGNNPARTSVVISPAICEFRRSSDMRGLLCTAIATASSSVNCLGWAKAHRLDSTAPAKRI